LKRAFESVCFPQPDGRFALSTDDIHLVKLDIEGAATEVIHWMCDNAFLPTQLLVEFDAR
jgi:hypothetical protein